MVLRTCSEAWVLQGCGFEFGSVQAVYQLYLSVGPGLEFRSVILPVLPIA